MVFQSQNFIEIGIFLLLLLVSVSLHELMHALVAKKLGDDLAHSEGRISLNPLKHIDPFLTIFMPALLIFAGLPPILAAKPVPINTSRIKGEEIGMAIVGVAGPLTNLLLAIMFGVVIQIVSPGGLAEDILALAVRLNVGLFVFNMLPIPPLDGSRLIYAFAPEFIQRAMLAIERLGIFGLVVIITLLYPVLIPILVGINNSILSLVL